MISDQTKVRKGRKFDQVLAGARDVFMADGFEGASVDAIARAAGVPVIALAGSLGEGYQRLYAEGIGAAFSLAPGPLSLEQAMQQAADQLSARAADLARLWQIAGMAARRV